MIRFLHERTLGNGPVQLINQLKENHSEEWLQRVARYCSECRGFLNKPGLQQVVFQEPLSAVLVPTYKWLLTVYSKDILSRLDDIKAAVTSIYGSILKMDSTKKVRPVFIAVLFVCLPNSLICNELLIYRLFLSMVTLFFFFFFRITNKLSGPAKKTAQWLTSVGNELGQVLISVLTTDEGSGVDAMAAGLVERYREAGVALPTLLYVDRHCCKEAGDTCLKQQFSGWPDIVICLDIWHYL